MKLRPINKKNRMNKKGQIETFIIIIVTLFIVAILLFFLNHLNEKIYTSLDDYFEDSEFNQSEAHQTLEKFQALERTNMWDWVFLAVFIGLMIQMIVFSFASKTNIAFFWIFILVGIIILILGVMLSNIWQGIAENPEFATTILRFPITNTLLGTNFPIVIVAFLFIGMIVLFGKFPGQGG
ncbi:hypothetical protein LCGC14_1080150 [marine sediment metagenome]|uniref:Uncharacterized protein n=1 Tax=marine sediment metagenome TaxID=412755 RepID=A0A0F9N340_9ZZZZ